MTAAARSRQSPMTPGFRSISSSYTSASRGLRRFSTSSSAAGSWRPKLRRTISARDTRVRWALEEVGQPYEVRLVSFAVMKEPAHLALHPFGQIPTYEEDDLALFETGSIVLHIAERHAGLLPDDTNARARAITWMFAAVNTVEPPILDLATARVLERDKPWYEERLPLVLDRVRARMAQLSTRL